MTGRIGYYVHHVGSGHRQRATALATRLVARGVAVTGLSSLARPAHWPGEWVRLAPDDDPPPAPDADPTAHGRLHWAPLHHAGLARRTAQLSGWLAGAAPDLPDLVVSDVSQEVAVLARLHGVPVISVLLPGRRDDPAHVLGLEVSSDVVAFWPDSARAMAPGLPASVERRLHRLGGMCRFDPEPDRDPHPDGGSRPGRGSRRGVVLAGSGGGAESLVAAAHELGGLRPDWSWRVLGADTWVDDPWTVLRRADVVLTHAGQNAVAEVAAARVPAIVIAQPRPHDEQAATARTLDDPAWPAVVVGPGDPVDAELLDRAAALDAQAWAGWVDGRAADRFADLVLARCRARADHRVDR